MTSADVYIRQETVVSIAINTVLSLAFFLLVFGRHGPVTVWGAGNYVFDFAAQGFMIALMATLVPGALAVKALRAGKVAPVPPPPRLPANLVLCAVLLGVIGAAIGVLGASAILSLVQLTHLSWWPALTAKLIFGAALAAVVTPIGLRAALIAR